MKPIFMGFCLAAAATAVSVSSCSKKQHENPFLKPYETIYEIPPFEDILIEDYIPAFDAGIAEAKNSIDSIVNNPEAPTFANTILPLDYLSPTLERVMGVLMSLTEAHSSPELIEVSENLLPRYTAFNDELMMNQGLFNRVKEILTLHYSLISWDTKALKPQGFTCDARLRNNAKWLMRLLIGSNRQGRVY